MSRAGAQTLSLLVVVNGLIKAIDKCMLSEGNKATLLYTLDVTEECIIKYPVTSETKRMRDWMKAGIAEFDGVIRGMTDKKYTAGLISSMCTKIMTDLTERIKDKAKLKSLQPSYEAVMGLHDLIDPKGSMYEEYDDADDIVQRAYSIFGFVPLQ